MGVCRRKIFSPFVIMSSSEDRNRRPNQFLGCPGLLGDAGHPVLLISVWLQYLSIVLKMLTASALIVIGMKSFERDQLQI